MNKGQFIESFKEKFEFEGDTEELYKFCFEAFTSDKLDLEDLFKEVGKRFKSLTQDDYGFNAVSSDGKLVSGPTPWEALKALWIKLEQ